jgi:PadR family transcriptional regulator, regulatory protein PadR
MCKMHLEMSDAPFSPTGFGAFGWPGKAPKNFLIPCLLLLLRQWNAHGYQLLQQLMAFGFAALDPATVYRTLRQLEKDGLVSSVWDTGHEGPARRVYSITDTGVAFLQAWAASLEQYRQTLDAFFDLYQSFFKEHTYDQPQPDEHSDRRDT